MEKRLTDVDVATILVDLGVVVVKHRVVDCCTHHDLVTGVTSDCKKISLCCTGVVAGSLTDSVRDGAVQSLCAEAEHLSDLQVRARIVDLVRVDSQQLVPAGSLAFALDIQSGCSRRSIVGLADGVAPVAGLDGVCAGALAGKGDRGEGRDDEDLCEHNECGSRNERKDGCCQEEGAQPRYISGPPSTSAISPARHRVLHVTFINNSVLRLASWRLTSLLLLALPKSRALVRHLLQTL
jgi:hypothetical protein